MNVDHDWSIPPAPARGPACPAAATLERLLAKEGQPPDLARHLAGCERCATHLASLEAAQEAFLKRRPPERFLRQLAARPELPSRARCRHLGRWLTPVLGLSVALGMVMLLVPSPRREAGVTLKGSPFSAVYVRRGATPRPITEGLTLRQGDAVRFFFQSDREGYLAILDLDSRRGASVLFPYGGRAPTRIAPTATRAGAPLPHTIVLDDAVGPERFVAVFAPEPFALPPLLDALQHTPPGAPVTLSCGGCRVEVLRFQKRP